MAYKNYPVVLNFSEGSGSDYDFPYLQNISDPIAGMKANVIKGNRASGCIVIKGGKSPIEIIVKGVLWSNEGYADLVSQINTMRTSITTNPAVLTLKHYDSEESGDGWITDWSYACIRIGEITFGDSMRTEKIEYSITFLVTGY